jgi:rifampin ADP-ribosylating transferase
MSGTLSAAIWGAELALGEGLGRIQVVEPGGSAENEPNVTDKKFPGNPTLSYRSKDPLRVIGEVLGWRVHSAEEIRHIMEGLEWLKQLGVEAIEDLRVGQAGS